MSCFSPEATEVNSTIDPPIRTLWLYTPGKKLQIRTPMMSWLVAMTPLAPLGFQVAIALPFRRGCPGPQRLLRRRFQRRGRGGGQRPQRGAGVEGAVVATGFLWPFPMGAFKTRPRKTCHGLWCFRQDQIFGISSGWMLTLWCFTSIWCPFYAKLLSVDSWSNLRNTAPAGWGLLVENPPREKRESPWGSFQ